MRKNTREMSSRNRAAWEYSEQHIHDCTCKGVGWVRLDVEPGHRFFGIAIPCVCLREKRVLSDTQAIQGMSGIQDQARAEYTFERFDPENAVVPQGAARVQVIEQVRTALAVVKAWAKEPAGRILILIGAYGSGKTHLAIAAANELMARGQSVQYGTVPGLMAMIQQGIGDDTLNVQDRIEALANCDLLVLDDFGAEMTTAFRTENLYRIINQRIDGHRAMIVTSNMDVKQLEKDADRRLMSRLLDGINVTQGRSRVLMLPCGDYRKRREIDPQMRF